MSRDVGFKQVSIWVSITLGLNRPGFMRDLFR